MLYVIGVVLMMGADGQKFFALREKRRLLDDCYMKWSRNPNYVGEMMIYASFALVAQRWEPWYILGFIWSVIFSSRMMAKEYSLSKKNGYDMYSSHSWMLPFKFGGNIFVSVIIYGLVGFVANFVWQSGSLETALKLVFGKQ